MRIAIVEQSQLMPDVSSHKDWLIDHFSSSKDFGKVKLKEYDAVIVDYNLPGTKGTSLINALSEKTNIEFALLNDSSIDEDVINNNRISAIIDKNVDKIIEWLNYIDVKIRLNKSMKIEKDKYNNILSLTNGFVLTIRNDIAFLGFSKPLSKKGRATILSAFESAKSAIVYYSNDSNLTSTYLGDLVSLHKEMKKKNKKLVFMSEDERIISFMTSCNLDKIIPIVQTEEQAIDFVTS